MLKNEIKNSALFNELLPIAEGLGLVIVDAHKNVLNHNEVQICIDIMNSSGDTSIDNCEQFHRAIQPRLELEIGRDVLSMEVSTPGLQRNIKDVYEFSIFTGRQVRVYSLIKSSWIAGIILESDDESVTLNDYKVIDTNETGEIIKIQFNDIQKAKLEYKVENKKN